MEEVKQPQPITVEPHVVILGEEIKNKSRRNLDKDESVEVSPRTCGDKGFGCYSYSGPSFCGLVFIAVGGVLLLNSFGILPWEVWNALSVLWPAFIILMGIKILLGNNIIGRFISSLFALVLIAFILLVGLVKINSPIISQINLPAELINLAKQIK